MKLRFKLILFQVLNVVMAVLPLIAYFIYNRDVYTETPEQTVKLTFGGIMVIVFITFALLGKLKAMNYISGAFILLLFAWFLEAIIDDLIVISFLMVLGGILSTVLFGIQVKRIKQQILINKTADATSERVEILLDKYVGRV